jgi:hypothetical protein
MAFWTKACLQDVSKSDFRESKLCKAFTDKRHCVSMNELRSLQALGLVLPSPSYIAGAIMFGIIGYVAFRRGRKTSRTALTWAGFALMLYPTPFRRRGFCGLWELCFAAGSMPSGIDPGPGARPGPSPAPVRAGAKLRPKTNKVVFRY